MATEQTPSTEARHEQPERVYVEIPRASRGQGYHAPKTERQPVIELVSRVVTVLLCLSLPAATALIFGMILGADPNSRSYLWVWIPMILLVEALAILLCIGVARQALGLAGEGFHEPDAGRFTRP